MENVVKQSISLILTDCISPEPVPPSPAVPDSYRLHNPTFNLTPLENVVKQSISLILIDCISPEPVPPSPAVPSPWTLEFAAKRSGQFSTFHVICICIVYVVFRILYFIICIPPLVILGVGKFPVSAKEFQVLIFTF